MLSDRCCDGFTRAQALRHTAFEAQSRKVREWTRGMPIPAGAGLDRRRFLALSLGGLVSVYGAARLGLTPSALEEGIAAAAARQGPTDPVLVSVFLPGGMDGLSVLAPVADPTYARLRPTLALSADATLSFAEDPTLRWHPTMRPIAALHDVGKVTVLPAIGYSSPDMSHFTSRHYWEVGAADSRLATGWLGRYLDVSGSPDNPLQGLSLDGQMNPTIATVRNPVAAIDRPEDFGLWLQGVWGDPFTWMLDTINSLGRAQQGAVDASVAQVAEAASEALLVDQTLDAFRKPDGTAAYTSPVPYPSSQDSDFPQRLAGLAALLAAGVPIRCVAVTAPLLFDTHASQAGTLTATLSLLARSIAAFQADLEARGIADRVLTHVWSEFGRRVQENGSAGTDHGAAGLSLLIGTRATGTMVGEWPGLAVLDPSGNLRETVDFRGMYCSLLEQWLDHEADTVIPTAAQLPRYRVVS